MMKMVEPMNEMKGGIIINSNISSYIPTQLINFESCFYYFVKNSKWEYIKGSNLSASGLIFKCVLSEGIESPFINIRLGKLGKPVKEIILKFVILHNERGKYKYFFKENNKIQSKEKKYENHERFLNEIEIQNTLTREDLLFLDPICPFLIYSDVISENDWPSFYNNFFNEEMQLYLLENIELFDNYNDFKNTNEANEIVKKFNENETMVSMVYLSQLIEKCLKKNLSLGLIGMEMLEDSYSLYNYHINIKSEKDEHIFLFLANIVIYEAIQLAIKGVVHGDLHMENVFVNENYNPYFNDIPLKIIIIDYGYANKIKYDKRIKIIQKWNEICDIPEDNINVQSLREKMNVLISLVFNTPRIDGGIVVFDWVNKYFNAEFIYKIHKKRMNCIEDTIIPLLKNIHYDEEELDASVYNFTRTTGGKVIKRGKSDLSFLSASSSSFKKPVISKISKTKGYQFLSSKNNGRSKSADSYKKFVSNKSYNSDMNLFDKSLKNISPIFDKKVEIKEDHNIEEINKEINNYFNILYQNNEELEKKLKSINALKPIKSKKTKKLLLSKMRLSSKIRKPIKNI